jgi:hypothetical protein
MSPIFFIECVWKEAFLLFILSTIAELILNIKRMTGAGIIDWSASAFSLSQTG